MPTLPCRLWTLFASLFGVATEGGFLGCGPVAADSHMWGHTPGRNMVSPGNDPPVHWDVKTQANIAWTAELGSKAYGEAIVADGVVYVGTNNEACYDKKYTNPDGTAIDGGVLLAFDADSGAFLWQRYTPKLPSGRVNDWPGEGQCGSVYVEGGRLWYATNRCEVVCLDVRAGRDQRGEPPVLWSFDMIKQLGVFPHNMTRSHMVAHRNLIYVVTGNGVDDTHKNVVAPNAPSLVCLDKNTGRVVWTDRSPGDQILHGTWGIVALAEANGRMLVVAPQGDGWVRAFEAETGKLVWKFDTNPKDSIYPQTRNELIGAPVIVGNRMYIGNGQDPEHGTGYAHFWCVRTDLDGDVSSELPPDMPAAQTRPRAELLWPATAPGRKGKPNPNSGVVWHYYSKDENGDGKIQDVERFHRTISTAAVYNGLVFAADFSGYLHCFDADTGQRHWAADLEADVWASPLVVEGKVYLGDGDGDVHVFAADRTLSELAMNNMQSPVYTTPAYAGGTLYLTSMNRLHAIRKVPGRTASSPGDWPMWGGSPGRNMVSPAIGLPGADVRPGKVRPDDPGNIDLSAARHVAWVAPLGSFSYGNPTVAAGRVYVGTNNDHPRDPKYKGDHGILLCLDEASGGLLWQLAVPKLAAGRNVDWEGLGVCSGPAVDGDRVYLVTGRCEILCLDARGLTDGNAGPFLDEARYTAGPDRPPVPQGPGDADIVWRYDLRHELGVVPRYQTSSSPLVVGDRLYVTTSNGTDWTDKHVPSPDAPALICLDKRTGRLLGQERSGISRRTFYTNWSSPAFGDVGGRPTLVFGGGDGFVYGFDPVPAPDGTLAELWRFDANPPGYRTDPDGKPRRYRSNKGPSEVLATPVVHDGRVYVAIGQDPENASGISGCLNCVAVTYDTAGRATAAGAWRTTEVSSTMSAVSIGSGLLFVAETNGFVRCLDPAIGAVHWSHDVESMVWGSTLLADGKVYVGTDAAELVVLAAAREKRVLGTVDFESTIYSTPVAAGRTLYVMTSGHLYALAGR